MHIRNGYIQQTASPHSQKVERRREHENTIISFKIDATNN
jgi:hypothetical protein